MGFAARMEQPTEASCQYVRKTRFCSRRSSFMAALTLICFAGMLCGRVTAQDASEALGPKDNATRSASTPLLAEMKTLQSSVRPELAGVHPRVYFTGRELEALRAEAHGAQKVWWQQQLQHIRALQAPPPPPPAERDRYRSKIARQGHLLYEFFAPRPGRSWAYSQNHTFIPMAGLGVAAYAVYGEVPEAKQWAALARAIYSKVLETYSKDGYYYEGFEYWIFSTPWIIHYLDAQKHATGEDLFDQPGLRKTHLYAAHSLTPGGQMMFDFGDAFAGPITRAKSGEDYERSHPGGHFESNYNVLYDLAARYSDSEIQGVADWMRSMGHTGQEEWWTLAWRNPKLKSTPIEKMEPWHRFEDHDVVFWRSGWDANATAIAFKCGPPEGHSATDLIATMPDWHTEQGHVHPDVNSFILWAHGQYLTGDSEYAGVPLTIEHNTLLVDGHGQGHEGKGHDAWAGFPYEQMNKARITLAQLTSDGFELEGEGAAVYDSSLGLKRYLRRLTMN